MATYYAISNPVRVRLQSGWKYAITCTSGDDLVKQVVYTGYPYNGGSASNNTIIINNIAKQFIKSQMPQFEGISSAPVYSRNNFVYCDVRAWSPSSTTYSYDNPEFHEDYVFANDWSYGEGDPEPYGMPPYSRYKAYAVTYSASSPYTGCIVLNDPINGHASQNQDIIFNVWYGSGDPNDGVDILTQVKKGDSYTKLKTYNSFDMDKLSEQYSNNVSITVGRYDNVDDVVAIQKSNNTIPSAVYDKTYCGDYALYYLNAFGGYDSFLIEHNLRETQSISTTNFGIANSAVNYMARGNNSSVNVNVKTYSFNTGWLSDEQSAKVYLHLLNSPEVYLWDCKKATYRHCRITGKSVEKKKFINGRKLVSYDISIEEIYQFERR